MLLHLLKNSSATVSVHFEHQKYIHIYILRLYSFSFESDSNLHTHEGAKRKETNVALNRIDHSRKPVHRIISRIIYIYSCGHGNCAYIFSWQNGNCLI